LIDVALYIVKAKPISERLENLRKELDSGDISRLEPFGEELHQSLRDAKIDSRDGSGYAYWVEEDYCRRLWPWNERACWTGTLKISM
jgi:hypothetical protein